MQSPTLFADLLLGEPANDEQHTRFEDKIVDGHLAAGLDDRTVLAEPLGHGLPVRCLAEPEIRPVPATAALALGVHKGH